MADGCQLCVCTVPVHPWRSERAAYLRDMDKGLGSGSQEFLAGASLTVADLLLLSCLLQLQYVNCHAVARGTGCAVTTMV
ncbi:hypothetical protein E2C01_058058 [Portunus trituberculatus]|uniref:Glutathione S-transferase C-terminal domain-containing protein n=1 Tax=Portunus trituberculatus TaxID=210409 RepID=A0A5B7GV67_PORTR|nr:hypothetical protein [Portunus trituberculatus]